MDSQRFIYSGDQKREISFPLGGVGTGCFGLSANGRLIDWEIFNRPDKGADNGLSHFAIKAEKNGQLVDARIINGPFEEGSAIGEFKRHPHRGYGVGACVSTLAGMPHFRTSSFEGTFPCATVQLSDPHFPGNVSVRALSPFIPLNSEDSSLPVAMFRIIVENNSNETIDYTLSGVLGNPGELSGDHTLHEAPGQKVLWMKQTAPGNSKGKGDVAIAAMAEELSCQRYWYRGAWFDHLNVYWNEFTSPGFMKDRCYSSPKQKHEDPLVNDHGVVCARLSVKPGEKKSACFVIAWHYPEQSLDWRKELPEQERSLINYYATRWDNACHVAQYTLDNWNRLEGDTLKFRDILFNSSLPESVIDAVSANLSVLRSPTVLRLTDGTLWGWEGGHLNEGSCPGSCTHVWNYQQAVGMIFPDLERSLRESDFAYNFRVNGGMSFRLMLPLGSGFSFETACVDGQMGSVLKTYRDWKNGAGDEWLAEMWPSVKKALIFAWSESNPDQWDIDKTGVLHGRQHHTLDMELFGANAWLTGFYLAALKAASEMAGAINEPSFSKECSSLYSKGRLWVENNLFNGDYFEQKIQLDDYDLLEPYDSGFDAGVCDGSVTDVYWSNEIKEIKYQLGSACFIDQAIGQWHAHLYGLGDILDQSMVKKALISIYKNNFKQNLWEHVNPCRIFAFEDEAATTLCTWPDSSNQPSIPVPYAEETFTGNEYAFACQLIYQGFVEEGVNVVTAVRNRYSGRRRNPWSEIECGSNYARSMASFALLSSWLRQDIDANNGFMSFNPVSNIVNAPWFTAIAWGEISINKGGVELEVVEGEFNLNKFELKNTSEVVEVSVNNQPIDVSFDGSTIQFSTSITIGRGDFLKIAF